MTKRTETETSNLPTFKDEAEAAAFWDTHSPLDYPEDFTEAEVTFDRPLIKRGLTIKLSEETIAQLRELAQDKGIGPTTLARMWILEHLKAEGKQSSGGRRS
jgi:hypothetical protein